MKIIISALSLSALLCINANPVPSSLANRVNNTNVDNYLNTRLNLHSSIVKRNGKNTCKSQRNNQAKQDTLTIEDSPYIPNNVDSSKTQETSAPLKTIINPPSTTSNPFLTDCLDKHNEIRRKYNVPELELDDDVTRSAQASADNIAAHYASNGLQHDVNQLHDEHLGENLAEGTDTCAGAIVLSFYFILTNSKCGQTNPRFIKIAEAQQLEATIIIVLATLLNLFGEEALILDVGLPNQVREL